MKTIIFVQDFLSAVQSNLDNLFVIPRGNSNDPEQRQKDPKAVCARHEFGSKVSAIVRTVIQSLTVSDFQKLQLDTDHNLGDLYVFRKKYRGVTLYVKLRLDSEDGGVVCHSFHEWTNK